MELKVPFLIFKIFQIDQRLCLHGFKKETLPTTDVTVILMITIVTVKL